MPVRPRATPEDDAVGAGTVTLNVVRIGEEVLYLNAAP